MLLFPPHTQKDTFSYDELFRNLKLYINVSKCTYHYTTQLIGKKNIT